jgi:hypothetical protein
MIYDIIVYVSVVIFMEILALVILVMIMLISTPIKYFEFINWINR